MSSGEAGYQCPLNSSFSLLVDLYDNLQESSDEKRCQNKPTNNNDINKAWSAYQDASHAWRTKSSFLNFSFAFAFLLSCTWL